MGKLKALVSRLGFKAKHAAAMATVGCMTAITSVVASAEETTGTELSNYSDQIISQFTGAAEDIVPIVVGVMGAGLTIFVIFIGIKFGKKMFNTVSK